MKFDPDSAAPEQAFDPTTAVPEEAPPVRAVLQTAVKQNPDQVARATVLGKQYGVPTDLVVRNLQNLEFQAAVDAADERLKTSPKLAAAMRKRPDIAPLAHDDLGPLTEIEAAVRKHGELKAWNGPAPTLKNIVLGLAKAVPQAGSAIKAGLDAEMTDFLEWTGLITLDPIIKADRARKLAQATGAADFTRPDIESSTGRAIYGGVESTLRMIPGLAASIATRSPTPMLAAAGVQTQGEAYGKYRTRGGSGGEAFLGATAEAAVEVATELIPAGFLTSRLGKAGVGEFVTGLLAREIPGEQIATLLQDAIDTAVANPDKTWGEYLAERPQAAYETLVSTLTQSALMGGVHGAARRLAQMGDQGQQAGEASDALKDALKTAGAAALRERSPEQFRALMGEMTDGKIYVDGQVLNQLPPDVIASLPQAVQDQIATAAATGDVVEISTADALTVAPGTALEEVLVEHARTDPFAMSKADAAEATKLAQSSVMNDAQRLIQQAQDTEARQAEYDAIHKLYADQLNATARFRPAVNEAKAHWLASFYTTMAARTGMTPAQFQAAHPVSILGAPTSATGPMMDTAQLEQATAAEAVPTGKISPITRKPIFELRDASGQRIGLTHSYDTAEEAVSKFNAPKPQAPVAPTYTLPEQELPKRSNWKQVKGQAFTALDEDDGSLYHVTAAPNAGGIRTDGLVPGQASTFGGGYAGYSAGKVFLTERSGVSFWKDKVEQMMFHNSDNPPAVVVMRIPKNKITATLTPDDVGTKDANARAYSSTQVLFQPGTPAFDNWFGDSKVRDAEGKPLVVYHGAPDARFATPGKGDGVFKTKREAAFGKDDGRAFFFAASQGVARTYADPRRSFDYQNAEEGVVPVYLSLRNPMEIDAKGEHWRGTEGVIQQAREAGHDGVIIRNSRDTYQGRREDKKKVPVTDVYVAFRPEQIKSATGNNGNYDPQNPSILEQAARAPKTLFDQARDAAFKRWSNDAPLVTSADATTRQFKTGEKVVVEAFHGTKRPDRVGTKFLKKRATSGPMAYHTSGPMAYHTSDPTLASSYATGKQDTSLSMEEQDYSNWFKVKLPGERSASDLVRSWYRLDPAIKDKIAALAPRVMFSDEQEADGGNAIVLGPEDRNSGTGSYAYNLAATRTSWDRRGNPLKALVEDWLNSGNLFNDEERFTQVLNLAGFPMQMVEYDSPTSEYQFVYKNYIAMQKPLVTSDVPQEVKDALNAAAKRDRSRAAAGGADAWDKNTKTLREWVAAFNGEDDTYVWTSIPDKVTEVFKSLGYDGIIDWSGKGGGPAALVAPVYIPFEETQVKSALGNKGKFDTTKNDILKQEAPTPRGTFNPATLEIVLNPNANLSSFFHETGHFFLEVLADVASQPNAPAQIVEDMNTFLKWAGIADLQTWNAMTLDQKRAAHERWAESIEQYVMEGKAPSVELQPLMRRFATWLKSVYGSIQKFLAARGQASAVGGSELNQAAPNDKLNAWFNAAGENTMVAPDGAPQVLYHGTTKVGAKSVKTGQFKRSAYGAMGPAVYLGDDAEVAGAYDRGAVLRVYARGKYLNNRQWTEYVNTHGWKGAEAAATADGWAGVYDTQFENAVAVWNPANIKSVNAKGFKDDGKFLSQDPNAKPAGPPMALNDDIRRVMDRLLATDEQIAQANEVAGLVPDEAADAAAAERLAKRSIADLKWSVRARDQVIAKLQKQAKAIEKDLREQVTVEVDQTPEMRAKRALDALSVSPEYAGTLAEHKAARKAAEAAVRDEVKAALLATNPDAKGLVKGQLLMKNKRDIDNKVESAMIKWDQENPTPKRPVNATDADVATIADSFGFESVDAMMQAIDAFGSRREAIDGLTEKRMLEEHGDLIDERAISEAANEAVHNEARARSLATELRTQREMLNPRQDAGETTAKGSKITVNALVEAAKQFAANVVGRTTLRDLTARAWQHTAAERRAAARWQQATAAGKTEEAVKAKQDQMLNHAAAKATIDAKAEAKRILDFFKRVTKGNNETVVEKGRDADIVNAARAVLAAYGVQTSTTKSAADYLETLSKNDPETYNVIAPMVEGATRNAQPLDALTFGELQALEEEIQAMWFLAKRSRQMEVDGDLLDVEDVAAEVYDRLEEIGIPDTLPGETGALTNAEIQARRWLQQVPALLRRVEQWAEAKDGKFGGPFSRFIFGPVKTAADAYRTARLDYRKRFQVLVDQIAPMMPVKTIAAPELNYVFGRGHNGIGMAELLHAIAHTGNESNKRKLLLGRGWATDNGDGTIDTGKWDAFIQRLAADGTLQREHFDFVQGVWDLMEQTKPLAQQTHRAVFGRYFAEVTADPFVDPFGVARAGGYIPAQADPLLVQDADLRELLETDNAGMSQAFPATNKGFTKARVEYNRPLKLDLRTLPQHIDKVLLFSHMEPAVRGVARLLRQPKVSQPLSRADPAAIGGMLKPWLNRSARQTVETPVSADAGLNRVLSTTRARVGMALMFANVSNTLQQITGFSSAALKVKPALMMRAAAQFIAHPKRFKDAVWTLSPYMADRASNEVSVLSDTMEKILINPGVFARAESWTRQHAYFLQTAFDNVMSPIIWSGAYNQGVAEGMDERMAVRYADGVIRQTQGSTLPEDVSRIETGPAYARVFTQFIGYFNMLANTNATALQQIAQEQGLKKGAGKAFGVVMLGLLAPIWVAEAIANGMRGGPDDEDDDGYLDDWLAAVFGFGTIRGLLSGVPFLGQAAQAGVNRFNSQPADDKFSLSPTVSVLESAVGAPASVYGAIVDDKNAQKAVRDVSALITVATGLPAMAAARPIGYLAGVAQGRVEPTGPVDAARGLITGTASPDSKQR